MARDAALVSPEQVVMGSTRGRARDNGWEVGTKEPGGQNESAGGPAGDASSQQRGPLNPAGFLLLLKWEVEGCRGQDQMFSQGKPGSSAPISTSAETALRHHLPAGSLSCPPSLPPSPAKLPHKKQRGS